MSTLIKETAGKMAKAVEHTLREFDTLHTGKASASMVENVIVDAYGTPSPLKQVAAITTPDMRTISIQPWDKSMTDPIVKGIIGANIGLNPVVNAPLIRIPIADLSRERRQELVKIAGTMAEKGRVSIRSMRGDARDLLKVQLKDKAITEDESKSLEKQIQDETDKHIKQIDEHLKHKETDLMRVG